MEYPLDWNWNRVMVFSKWSKKSLTMYFWFIIVRLSSIAEILISNVAACAIWGPKTSHWVDQKEVDLFCVFLYNTHRELIALLKVLSPRICCWCQSLLMHIRYLCIASPLIEILSFSWRFRQKFCQIIGWRHLWEILNQPLVKDTSFSFYKDLVMITNDNDSRSALGSRSHRYHILQTYFVLKLFTVVINFITALKRSCGKVMSLQVSVNLFTGGVPGSGGCLVRGVSGMGSWSLGGASSWGV